MYEHQFWFQTFEEDSILKSEIYSALTPNFNLKKATHSNRFLDLDHEKEEEWRFLQ